MKKELVYYLATHYICSMKGKRKYKVYDYNPSLMDLKEDGLGHAVNKVLDKPIGVVTDDGEEGVLQVFSSEVKYNISDKKPFLKLYKDLRLGELSKPSLMVLDYLHTQLKPKKDWVYIDVRGCMEFCGWKAVSRANYYKGIDGLLASEIIFNKVGNGSEYYINVKKLFNGDRRGLYDKLFIKQDADELKKAKAANDMMKSNNEEQDENNN